VRVQNTTYERSTLVNDEKYIGLDVHQATIVVAVMDSTGKLVMESILETKAATILQCKRLTNTSVRQAASVLKCPDDRKNRVVSPQTT
jgi:hypothetical protein